MIAYIILLLFPLFSHALVDLRNANYTQSYTDLMVPGTGYELSIARTYNSRSLYDGIFGFGWCTVYETTIEFTAEGHIELTECGGGLGIIYRPQNFSFDQISTTVNKIMAKFSEENKQKNSNEIKKFREEIESNEGLRAQYAKKYNILTPVKDDESFYAEGRHIERFVKKNDVYVRYLEDGSIQKYDNQGIITSMQDREGNYLKFNRANGLLTEIVDNNGRKINLTYYPNKKVKMVKSSNGQIAEYKFEKNDLIWVKNAWKNIYQFQYNNLHNLVRIDYPDKTKKTLTYNDKKDWVMSFTNRKKCIEKYDYIMSEDDPKYHYWSTVIKTCGNKVTNNSKYEFWHKERADKRGKYLHKAYFKVNNDVTEIEFHLDLGSPTAVTKNGFKTEYIYYPNGLIKERKDKFSLSLYEYNKEFNKVSKVSTTFFGDKDKTEKTRKTEFEYDKTGNITTAMNSDGQKAWVKYDEKGRISYIKDQSHKVVVIEYEERFGKPSIVERPGVGKIKVTYDENGNMKGVNSKAGPIVAQEVASTFNNLLEIVTPGVSQVSL